MKAAITSPADAGVGCVVAGAGCALSDRAAGAASAAPISGTALEPHRARTRAATSGEMRISGAPVGIFTGPSRRVEGPACDEAVRSIACRDRRRYNGAVVKAAPCAASCARR